MVAVQDADLFSALVSMLDSCNMQSHVASYILQLAKRGLSHKFLIVFFSDIKLENLRTAILGTDVVSALVQMLHGDNSTAREVGIETLLKLAECGMLLVVLFDINRH
jgi:hypothetical protein